MHLRLRHTALMQHGHVAALLRGGNHSPPDTSNAKPVYVHAKKIAPVRLRHQNPCRPRALHPGRYMFDLGPVQMPESAMSKANVVSLSCCHSHKQLRKALDADRAVSIISSTPQTRARVGCLTLQDVARWVRKHQWQRQQDQVHWTIAAPVVAPAPFAARALSLQ